MNKLLRVRAALQAWITANQDSPDVPRVQKVVEYLANLAETKEGTEFGKELLVRLIDQIAEGSSLNQMRGAVRH